MAIKTPQFDKLKKMIDEAEILDGSEPEEEVTEDDVEVGVMTEELKRMHALRNQIGEKARKLLDGATGKDLLTDSVLKRELHKLKSLGKTVDSLLWFSIREQYNLYSSEYDRIAIKKGWKVVYSNVPDMDDDFMDIINFLSKRSFP